MANSPYFMKLMQLQLKYIRFQLKITDEIAHGLYKYLEMTGFTNIFCKNSSNLKFSSSFINIEFCNICNINETVLDNLRMSYFETGLNSRQINRAIKTLCG